MKTLPTTLHRFGVPLGPLTPETTAALKSVCALEGFDLVGASLDMCTECLGTGEQSGPDPYQPECPACNGGGVVLHLRGNITTIQFTVTMSNAPAATKPEPPSSGAGPEE